MLKNISLLVRKPGMTHEQFVRHWVDVHAPLVAAVPQVRRYHQNLLPDGTANGVDGIAELWFESAAERDAFRASAAGQKVIADGANFMDGPNCRHFVVDAREVVA